ncbi:unnamed protein product [Acanthosepion pharaonis]|uniref:Uncharacterized protein n=1 Tax=Acanthosepion pharaonis TaxID=158019 RepID=A0A812BLS9_ACAPH|nr:unnamed protein product [Sepia pharaonis]
MKSVSLDGLDKTQSLISHLYLLFYRVFLFLSTFQSSRKFFFSSLDLNLVSFSFFFFFSLLFFSFFIFFNVDFYIVFFLSCISTPPYLFILFRFFLFINLSFYYLSCYVRLLFHSSRLSSFSFYSSFFSSSFFILFCLSLHLVTIFLLFTLFFFFFFFFF